MTVLGLDVGINTGYACLSQAGERLVSGTSRLDTVEGQQQFYTELDALIQLYQPRVCLVEDPVILGTGSLPSSLQTIVASLHTFILRYPQLNPVLFHEGIFQITPSSWKSTPAKVYNPFPLGTRKERRLSHELDAIRMSWWYIRWGSGTKMIHRID